MVLGLEVRLLIHEILRRLGEEWANDYFKTTTNKLNPARSPLSDYVKQYQGDFHPLITIKKYPKMVEDKSIHPTTQFRSYVKQILQDTSQDKISLNHKLNQWNEQDDFLWIIMTDNVEGSEDLPDDDKDSDIEILNDSDIEILNNTTKLKQHPAVAIDNGSLVSNPHPTITTNNVKEEVSAAGEDLPVTSKKKKTTNFFCCLFCNQSFQESEQLNQHKKLNHEQDNEVRCNQKGNHTTKKNTKKKTRNFPCSFCHKSFNIQWQLKQHTKLKHAQYDGDSFMDESSESDSDGDSFMDESTESDSDGDNSESDSDGDNSRPPPLERLPVSFWRTKKKKSTKPIQVMESDGEIEDPTLNESS